MGQLLTKLKEMLFQRKMEIVLLGLENSGKTTMLNQLSMGQALPSAPTIGLNIKQVKKDGINMKVWDIGGQVQFRREWGKYTKGSDVILFMLDASNVTYFNYLFPNIQFLERHTPHRQKRVEHSTGGQRYTRNSYTLHWK